VKERPEVTAEWEVAKLDLRPGDVIVFRVARNLTAEEADRIKTRCLLEFPENKCLVLAPGVDIEIVRPEGRE